MAWLPLSGKNSSIRVGTAIWYGKKWRVLPKTAGIDVTTFEDGGGRMVSSILEADVEILDSEYNAAAAGSPYSNPPNFIPGQTVNLILYIVLGGAAWNFANALVLEAENTSAVRETVKCPSIKFYGNGVYGNSSLGWTWPTQ